MRSRRRSPLRNEFEVSPQIFWAECSTRWLSAQHFRSIIQPNYHEVLKELMGHHSISLTLRYTKLYDTTKKHQYEQAMAQITQRQALGGR